MGEVPEETVRELYTALPEEFTAARDAAAAASRAAGQGGQATAIKRLRRPTVAAWLVNLLAHRAPDRIGELTELAAELRDAQRQLRGADLRTLTVRRRELLSALVEQAADLAVQAQPALSPAKLPLTEVEQTLAAALADGDVAAQVRAGTVVKAVSYTGFGAALPSGDEPDDNEPSADASADADADADDQAETGGRSAARGTVRATGGGAAVRTAAWQGPAAAAEGRTAARKGSVTATEGRSARKGSATAAEGSTAARKGPAAAAEPARDARTAVAEVEPPVPVGLRRELDSARDAERRARGEVETARAAEASAVDELAQLRDALAALEERRGRAQQEANGLRAARTAAERALAAAVRRTAKAQAAIDARAATS